MKTKKTLIAVVYFRNHADRAVSHCKQLLNFCDAILAIDESSSDGTRENLVDLEKELPIIIFDSPALTKREKAEKLLVAGANILQFFPFDYFIFIDFTEKNSSHRINVHKNALRKADTSSLNDPSLPFTNKSLFEKPLPRDQVSKLYSELFQPPVKTAKEKSSDPNLFQKFTDRIIYLLRKKLFGEVSGIFKSSFHSQNLYLDYPPFRFLSDKYSPLSVLDIGCGIGGYVNAYKNWGANEITGIDGFKETGKILNKENYKQHDLRDPLHLNKQFDLVICVEVAEHISSEFEHILLNTIQDHSKNRILFSAAQVGQPGLGHVNCKSLQYWVQTWQERGFVVNVFDTIAVRSLSTFLWFRNNLLVLETADSIDQKEPFTLNDKCLHNTINLEKWVNQPPKIYDSPLTESIVDIPS